MDGRLGFVATTGGPRAAVVAPPTGPCLLKPLSIAGQGSGMLTRVTTKRMGRRCFQAAGSWLLGWTVVTASLAAAEPVPERVEFNRDIRPLLSDTCFQCHGLDQGQRKADLRLDTEAGAFAPLDGRRAIVPGKPADSELYLRISAADADERMPPASSGRKLTESQIELIRKWIEQGAQWQKHWSFLPPQRPAVPAVRDAGWGRNPIDAFVLARLEREGLAPSPEADKAILIRRLTLDLTGLPPTPDEVDAFLSDAAENAYEQVVDRLLQSPRYGERMATRWLDAARYADTNGYQSDGERSMWRWRDWVIDAYNQNLPFDRFTLEQLAGDMLPHPTLEQRIATGFNRNHRGNAEGGIIPEEYAVEYVVDRVETTGTVWLGLTIGCGRCHDHKFDPITQKEFYQLFAFFNNVPEHGKAVKYGNSPPMIKAPTREQQQQLAEVERQIAAAESRVAALEPELAAVQAKWEQTLEAADPIAWSLPQTPLVELAFDGDTRDGGRTPQDAAPRVGKFIEGEPAFGAGHLGQAAEFDGQRYLEVGDVANFGYYDKFSCAAWVYLKGDGGAIVSRMTDTSGSDGWGLHVENGKVQVNLVKRWLDDAIRVETEAALPPNEWHHVCMSYDGTRLARGIAIYFDGKPQKFKAHVDELNQTFNNSEPLRIGAKGTGERFHGYLDDVRVYDVALPPESVEILATADSINDIAALSPLHRSAPQIAKLRSYFLEHAAPEAVRDATRQLADARQQRATLVEGFPTTMVMEEMPAPRPTHLLKRGEYNNPGERVTPGVPASLAPFPAGAPLDRVGLAQWLVDPSNPLTARVAVNRSWQMYFGTGLVKTVDDFGSQGEWPSHPELLDWLATEFMSPSFGPGAFEAKKWDVKRLQKLIVMSATYRQSSKLTPALLQKDPDNRLLARGPRIRLSAEMIRDQALAASGLLVEKIGGPSVLPYQPPGLWKELTGTDFTQDHGEKLYRRSMYTFWKRTVAPPSMMTFDASGREACSVRETRTNTPLQALTLMNEVTFVEAARALAQRAMNESGPSPEARLARAFRLVLARQPKPAELKILLGGFERHLARYREQPSAALELVGVGESPRDESLPPPELAAYTAIAGLILNLDEAITKE
jgi:mono/diheme cytochrome c family protein